MKDAQQGLVRAIEQQSLEGVKTALAAGADPNIYVDDHSMLGWHESAAGLLLEYEQPAWLDILKMLLAAGANPNLSIDRRSADYLLHTMSLHSILVAMRLLLDHGADPNMFVEGETALDWLSGDFSYEETCNLPDWYKGRVLPGYEAPTDNLEDRATAAIWLVARHQRGWAMLRQAGGMFAWELQQRPVVETLGLYPDRVGGLYTRHGRPDAGFLMSLESALNERLTRWAGDYKDPNLLGYEVEAVKRFDYAAHLAEGMAIGEAIAPFVPEGTTLEIGMATADSIAAKSTRIDVYTWCTHHRVWTRTVDWRDKLSPDWFGPQPTCTLRELARDNPRDYPMRERSNLSIPTRTPSVTSSSAVTEYVPRYRSTPTYGCSARLPLP